jgi:hypothetical protein
MQAANLKRTALTQRIVLGTLGVAIGAIASGLQAAPATPAGLSAGGPSFSAEHIEASDPVALPWCCPSWRRWTT